MFGELHEGRSWKSFRGKLGELQGELEDLQGIVRKASGQVQRTSGGCSENFRKMFGKLQGVVERSSRGSLEKIKVKVEEIHEKKVERTWEGIRGKFRDFQGEVGRPSGRSSENFRGS